jgi:hypothetical protein
VAEETAGVAAAAVSVSVAEQTAGTADTPGTDATFYGSAGGNGNITVAFSGAGVSGSMTLSGDSVSVDALVGGTFDGAATVTFSGKQVTAIVTQVTPDTSGLGSSYIFGGGSSGEVGDSISAIGDQITDGVDVVPGTKEVQTLTTVLSADGTTPAVAARGQIDLNGDTVVLVSAPLTASGVAAAINDYLTGLGYSTSVAVVDTNGNGSLFTATYQQSGPVGTPGIVAFTAGTSTNTLRDAGTNEQQSIAPFTASGGTFTLAMPNTFDALSLSPLLWFKADAGVTESGGNVTLWADQSGNGNNGTSSGVAKLSANVLNGLPVVEVTNFTDVATIALPPLSSSAGTMFAVFRNFVNNADYSSVPWALSGNTYMSDHGTVYDPYGIGDVARQSFAAPLDLREWTIYSAVAGASTWADYFNGALEHSATGTTWQDYLASPYLFYSGSFAGQLAEFIISPTALSDADRAKVEQYLHDKWISTPTTTPLAYNASAATVQAALEALSSIGSGNVSVSGSASAGFVVEFVGALAGQPVPLLSVGSNTLGTFTASQNGSAEIDVVAMLPAGALVLQSSVDDATWETIDANSGFTGGAYSFADNLTNNPLYAPTLGVENYYQLSLDGGSSFPYAASAMLTVLGVSPQITATGGGGVAALSAIVSGPFSPQLTAVGPAGQASLSLRLSGPFAPALSVTGKRSHATLIAVPPATVHPHLGATGKRGSCVLVATAGIGTIPSANDVRWGIDASADTSPNDVRYGVAVGMTTGNLVVPLPSQVQKNVGFDSLVGGTFALAGTLMAVQPTIGTNGKRGTAHLSAPMIPTVHPALAATGRKAPVVLQAKAPGALLHPSVTVRTHQARVRFSVSHPGPLSPPPLPVTA